MSESNLGKVVGSFWHHGAGAPPGGQGLNDDYYLNTLTGEVHRKAADVWSAPVMTIQGIPGLPAAAWLAGLDGPEGGNDGDFYLQTSKGYVYTRVEGVWGLIMTLRVGPETSIGKGRPQGGKDGDKYIDQLTGRVYEKKIPVPAEFGEFWTHTGAINWRRRMIVASMGLVAIGMEPESGVSSVEFLPDIGLTAVMSPTATNSEEVRSEAAMMLASLAEFVWILRTGEDIGNQAVWIGVSNSPYDQLPDGDSIGCSLRYDTSEDDVNFMSVNADGEGYEVIDSGIEVEAEQAYLMNLTIMPGPIALWRIYYYPEMNLLGSIENAGSIPSQAAYPAMGMSAKIFNLQGAPKTLSFLEMKSSI